MKTEKEKMLAGELYTPYDSELQQNAPTSISFNRTIQ